MSSSKKKILFLTGTRADFGKLKTLMKAVEDSEDFECNVFVTGMHTLKQYGLTSEEVVKAGFKHIHVYMNQITNEPMDMILANTIHGLARYVHESRPDLIVVHGDRVEALAGAIVGAMRNILVAHIEGGELSGTVDEILRHAVSKIATLHFVANNEAANRLRQLGELDTSIFVIGSPDFDVMVSSSLPSLDTAKSYYDINFDNYGIALYHPVTTEIDQMKGHAKTFVDAILKDKGSYVVIYPNNDEGASHIIEEYKRLQNNPRFRVFPSIRFEYFLTLLKNSQFVIGNSSAGIREAPFYGLPTVNIGSRQQNRFIHESIVSAEHSENEILMAINQARFSKKYPPSSHFGKGDSLKKFMEIIRMPSVWKISTQKQFHDLSSHPEFK